MIPPWILFVFSLAGCMTGLYIFGVRIRDGKVVLEETPEYIANSLFTAFMIGCILFVTLIRLFYR